MAELAGCLLERNGFTSDDLALVVPHQANLRIIRAMQDGSMSKDQISKSSLYSAGVNMLQRKRSVLFAFALAVTALPDGAR